jgi:NhaP-type Na+/H+ and K+/H+ antiporter
MQILSRKGKPNKVTSDYTLNDVYKEYLLLFNFPKTSGKYLGESTLEPVSKEKFKAINTRLYELIFLAVLEKSATVVLPFKLGELRVQKKSMPITFLRDKRKLKINFMAWRKTGKITYHLNEHRNYNRYKLYWAYANVNNIKSYRLEPIRKWHRMLASILLNKPHIDYFE